jgi:DNA-binding CsgD family transcriptional regulator
MSNFDHDHARFGDPRFEADEAEGYTSDIPLLVEKNQRPRLVGGVSLSDRELTFLRLACSEKTYFMIAREMFVSERTVDGYRDALFRKLNVVSRVGLVMYAIRNGIVRV